MKIRQGFVSNSSSSSFLIWVKPELTKEEVRELIFKELKITRNSPLYHLMRNITNFLTDWDDSFIYDSILSWKHNTDISGNELELLGQGFQPHRAMIYTDDICDAESSLGYALTFSPVGIKTPNLIIYYEEG
jgi:hypothetical protein